MATSQKSVGGGTAVELFSVESQDGPLVVVDNQGPATVYWGDEASVTADEGAALEEGDQLYWDLSQGRQIRDATYTIYAITDGGSASVRVVVSFV